VLLFLLTPPLFIPYFDRLHATMLFWLAPSQQIRPPIYSFRQRSQRRKIVFKCE
jgi:1,3-beta-glucan synthase